MARSRPLLFLSLACALTTLAWVQEPASASSAIERTGNAVDRTAHRTGAAIERGAERTVSAVQRGAHRTGAAIERGARRTGAAIDRGVQRTRKALGAEKGDAAHAPPG